MLLMLSPFFPICHTPRSPDIYITDIIFGGDSLAREKGNISHEISYEKCGSPLPSELVLRLNWIDGHTIGAYCGAYCRSSSPTIAKPPTPIANRADPIVALRRYPHACVLRRQVSQNTHTHTFDRAFLTSPPFCFPLMSPKGSPVSPHAPHTPMLPSPPHILRADTHRVESDAYTHPSPPSVLTHSSPLSTVFPFFSQLPFYEQAGCHRMRRRQKGAKSVASLS